MSKCKHCGVRLRRVFKTDQVCECDRVKRGRVNTNTVRRTVRINPHVDEALVAFAAAIGVNPNELAGAIIAHALAHDVSGAYELAAALKKGTR